AWAHLAKRAGPRGQEDHQGESTSRRQLHERCRERVGRGDLEVQAADCRVRVAETAAFVFLATVDLDFALPVHDFVDDAGDRADRILDALADAPIAASDRVDHAGYQR